MLLIWLFACEEESKPIPDANEPEWEPIGEPVDYDNVVWINNAVVHADGEAYAPTSTSALAFIGESDRDFEVLEAFDGLGSCYRVRRTTHAWELMGAEVTIHTDGESKTLRKRKKSDHYHANFDRLLSDEDLTIEVRGDQIVGFEASIPMPGEGIELLEVPVLEPGNDLQLRWNDTGGDDIFFLMGDQEFEVGCAFPDTGEASVDSDLLDLDEEAFVSTWVGRGYQRVVEHDGYTTLLHTNYSAIVASPLD